MSLKQASLHPNEPVITPSIRAKDAILSVLIAAIFFLVAIAAHAQVVGGSITGTLTDPSGAPPDPETPATPFAPTSTPTSPANSTPRVRPQPAPRSSSTPTPSPPPPPASSATSAETP
jgi:hypothetical protein